MAQITLSLPADLSPALRRFAAEVEQSREGAAVDALRGWLVGNGYLEAHLLDEDGETDGSA